MPPDKQSIKWGYDDPMKLLADPKFKKAIKLFVDDKLNELKGAISDQPEDRQKALKKGVLEPLSSEPSRVIGEVINWTLNTGGGILGTETDTNALNYYIKARCTKGGLDSLTPTQRIRLIQGLFSGIKVWEAEEDVAFHILRTANDKDARYIISIIGWERFEDEIGDRFSKRYPKSSYSY